MNITRSLKLSPIIGIVIGLLLFEFSNALQIFYGSDRLFKLLGLAFIFFFTFRAKKWSLDGRVKKLLVFLLLVEITMFVIGIFQLAFTYDPFDGSLRNLLRNLMFYPHSPLTYLFPLAAFLSFSFIDLKNLRTVTIIVICVQIILLIMNWNEVFSTTASITGRTTLLSETDDFLSVRELANSIFSGIGLVAFFTWNKRYLKNIPFLFLFFGLFLGFATIVAGGGRGNSAIIFGFILTAFYLNTSHTKLRTFKLLIALAFLVIVLIYLYNNTDVFSFLFNRIYEDDSYSTIRESNRTYFSESMIKDFTENPLSWLFGRGIYGAYLLPDGSYRTAMEWGWLYQILKGGVIYFMLYVGILLYSFKKAFFNSNNTLIKAMGFSCLWQVIELIPFGIPSMTAKYFLVWLFVGIISKNEIRNLYDKDIAQYLIK